MAIEVTHPIIQPPSVTPGPSLLELSVLLPAYNEHARIGMSGQAPGDNYRNTLSAYRERLERAFGPRHNDETFSMAIVDDGSEGEETARIAREYGASVLTHPDGQNHGRGAAYKVGFLALATTSKIIGAYDADGSYAADTIIRQYEAIRNGADAAIAYRGKSKDQHEKGRQTAHNVLRIVREGIAQTNIKDTQAGAFALSREAALFLFNQENLKERWAANHQLWHIAHLAGLRVEQMEEKIVPKGGSTVGASKVELAASALEMIRDTIDIRRSTPSSLETAWNKARLGTQR